MIKKQNSTNEIVKEYWNKRPCNIKHSRLEIGTKEYFDEVEKRKYFVEPHIPQFANFSNANGKHILEVGCGIGTDAVNFARNGAIYSGCDISDNSLNLVKKRFEVFDLKGNFTCCDAEQLSQHFPSDHFDLVYSFGVLHHTTNPKNAINEIFKIIKPNGELRIMLYAKNSWKNFMIEAELDQPEAQSDCPIANTYTKECVKELLQGFQIINTEQKHIFPYKVESYVQYKYEKESWFDSMPQSVFDVLESNLGWHLCITAKPIK